MTPAEHAIQIMKFVDAEMEKIFSKDEAPDCEDCNWSYQERDPHGTGDSWYVVTQCKATHCPYGKE